MTIVLRIENVDSLPDGGPLEFSVNKRGFDFGRDPYLDWTLPDPSRFISGRHCEVRYRDGGYWLNDPSSNGTFVNGSSQRIKSPYRLQDGDRLSVGNYIIAVSIEGDEAGRPAPQAIPRDAPERVPSPYDSGDVWGSDDAAPAPPPIDRRDLMPPERRASREADFGEQFIDLPTPIEPEPPRPPEPRPAALSTSDVRQSSFSEARVPLPVESEHFGAGSARSQPELRDQPRPTPGLPRSAEMPPAEPDPTYERSDGARNVLAMFAKGAGISPDAIAHRDPGELALEIGEAMRIQVEEMAQLLRARAAAKTLAKSSNRTMIGATNNNPLKFIPSPEEVIEIMLGQRRAGFMGIHASFEEGFRDLKTHEQATWSAMQKALARVVEDLDPEAIEKKVSGSTFSSKKARAWETYVTIWEAKTDPHENGILDVFLDYFADYYDQQTRRS